MRDGLEIGQNNELSPPKRDLFLRLKKLFRRREILLRNQGKVTFISLSPRLQASVAAFGAGFILWSVGATGLSIWQSVIIEERETAIVEAKLSQQRVAQEFSTYKAELDRIGDILGNLGHEVVLDQDNPDSPGLTEEMLAFRVLGDKVRQSLERAELDFAISVEQENRIVSSRSSLHDEIMSLQEKLQASKNVSAQLLSEKKAMEEKLAGASSEYASLLESKNILGRQVRDLTMALSQARDYANNSDSQIKLLSNDLEMLSAKYAETKEEISRLGNKLETAYLQESDLIDTKAQAEKQIAYLNSQIFESLEGSGLLPNVENKEESLSLLDNMPLEGRLDVLEENTSILVGSLREYQNMSRRVEQTLDQVVGGLSKVSGTSLTELDPNYSKPDQAITLLGQLENLHEDQIDIVGNLLERTERAISFRTATLQATGIDLDAALAAAGYHSGTGGPLEESQLDFEGNASNDLSVNVAILDEKAKKLQALDKLIACVPMVSPVDYYHVTSKFGKRKDPFTNKVAMHKGVDLGGWPGTKVHATAGGTVKRAGYMNGYGKMVEIDHGCGVTTIYGHLKKVLVKKGELLNHRDVIGKLGSTGRSTGPHVHFEIQVNGKPVDPLNFIEAGKYAYRG
ncbi:MAG: peptidoglycan DD-metalloendopeptidase family protein [Alphaproteobacteria bacterium]|nr:peptidoglycan DD-metalloendopeptidase family protein [Alphaproteobacteria bacterium]